jgi:hypothetical protein
VEIYRLALKSRVEAFAAVLAEQTCHCVNIARIARRKQADSAK